MPKPSVVIPQWMLDEIDDRRHSRTDRSKWIREAIASRLEAENHGEWDESGFGSDECKETDSSEVGNHTDV